MKGIILAGGKGTRLYPLTQSVSKQMLPVYDKPMIYYPISTLMLAGIREILIISSPNHLQSFKTLLGNGSKFGLEFSYIEQENPDGLPSAFLLGEQFIGNDSVCMILGDNIFYGPDFDNVLKRKLKENIGATIFGYHVSDPKRYGVLTLNKEKIISIEEKPKKPKSNFAVTGLYIFNNNVIKYAKKLRPSNRGETEIVDLLKIYLLKKKLKAYLLNSNFTWLDTGTNASLIKASSFIETIENRNGYKIACIEEIAYKLKWISKSNLKKQISIFKNSEYGKYILKILK